MKRQAIDAMKMSEDQLISGRVLVRNSVWNIIGQGTPFLFAIFAIPLLIKGLGTVRFGVLTLAWMVVGYFSLFDMGLGRALTNLVSQKLGDGSEEEIPSLVWTALCLMGFLGISGGALFAGLSPRLVYKVLKIPATLQEETLKSFYLLGVSIPIVISIAGLRGLLEAYQRFKMINAVRIPQGIFTLLGPVAVLPFSNSLIPVVAVLISGRIVALFIYLVLCFRSIPALRFGIKIRIDMVRPLLRFGGWMTVSNIIGPLMLYLDRFLIAGFISVTAVAYYTTPYEVVTKLLIIPSAVLGVMFPAFSVSFSKKSARLGILYKQVMKYVFLIMLPIVLALFFIARYALAFWLNDEFATNSFLVAQLLAIGVLINALGMISQSLVQAVGRPDLTAKLHLVELPMYLIYLWNLLHAYGINGAAFAWLIRVTISAIVLRFLAHRSIFNIENQKTMNIQTI